MSVKLAVSKLNNYIAEKASYITSIGDGFDEAVDGIISSAVVEFKDSLGENARRMLGVGILQDELAKLGFNRIVSNYELDEGGNIDVDLFISSKIYNYYDEELDESYMGKFYIAFQADSCIFFMDSNSWIDSFGYDEDVLTKIKELIK